MSISQYETQGEPQSVVNMAIRFMAIWSINMQEAIKMVRELFDVKAGRIVNKQGVTIDDIDLEGMIQRAREVSSESGFVLSEEIGYKFRRLTEKEIQMLRNRVADFYPDHWRFGINPVTQKPGYINFDPDPIMDDRLGNGG